MSLTRSFASPNSMRVLSRKNSGFCTPAYPAAMERLNAMTSLAFQTSSTGMPAIGELRSAVIWVKAVSTYRPDYYVETLPTSPWIHQPFEEYDALRPEGLARKYVV